MRHLAPIVLLAAAACASEPPSDGTAATAAAPAAANAPDRWRIITAASGDSSFVDTGSITDSAGARIVWIRRRWQPAPGGEDSATTRYAFRCGARELRTWEETGVVGGIIRPEGWREWAPVEPATWEERAMRVACDSVGAPP